MQLHELREIQAQTQSLLSSINDVISDIEARSSEPPRNPENNVQAKRFQTQQINCDGLYTTLSNIITKAGELRDVLKPDQDGKDVLTPAPEDTISANLAPDRLKTTTTAAAFCTTQKSASQTANQATEVLSHNKQVAAVASSLPILSRIVKNEQTVTSAPIKAEISTPIALTDDESDNEMTPITCLPLEDPNPSRDVQNLISFCLANKLSPHLLGCGTVGQMKKKLERFLPGEWLDDGLLRTLLQVISSNDQYLVIDSIKLDICMPETLEVFVQDKRGLIFPFHVNDREPLSPTATKNHWVLATFDKRNMRFTSFGIDEALMAGWVSVLQASMMEVFGENRQIELKAEQLPLNPDSASCALVCCLALEKHLGTYQKNTEPPSLRGRYLRKLLRAFVFSYHHKELTGDFSPALVLYNSSLLPNNLDLDEIPSSVATLDDLSRDLETLSNTNLKVALADKDCKLTLQDKARTLQLIMQCSNNALEAEFSRPENHVQGPPSEVRNRHEPMLIVLEEIDRTKSLFDRPTLQQRMLYIKLAKLFSYETRREEKRMRLASLKRKRMRAVGLGATSECRDKCENRVLDRLIMASTQETTSETPGTTSKTLRARLMSYIKLGSNLDYLCSVLGTGLLLTFPADTCHSCDLSLDFPSARNSLSLLATPIEASLYSALQGEEAQYFVKWFPTLRTDLMPFSSLDYRLFLPRTWFDWKRLPENLDILVTQLQDVSARVWSSKRSGEGPATKSYELPPRKRQTKMSQKGQAKVFQPGDAGAGDQAPRLEPVQTLGKTVRCQSPSPTGTMEVHDGEDVDASHHGDATLQATQGKIINLPVILGDYLFSGMNNSSKRREEGVATRTDCVCLYVPSVMGKSFRLEIWVPFSVGEAISQAIGGSVQQLQGIFGDYLSQGIESINVSFSSSQDVVEDCKVQVVLRFEIGRYILDEVFLT